MMRRRILMLAIFAAILAGGCACTGTQEGAFFVGHTFCPQEWGRAHRDRCVRDCYEAAITKLGHDDGAAAAACSDSCR